MSFPVLENKQAFLEYYFKDAYNVVQAFPGLSAFKPAFNSLFFLH